MVDLDKIYDIVEAFLDSSRFLHIMQKRLFFPECVQEVNEKTFKVVEILYPKEMQCIAAIAKKHSMFLADHLYVLLDGHPKKAMYTEEDFEPFTEKDFEPFMKTCIKEFEIFVSDVFPLLYPDQDAGLLLDEYLNEGILMLQVYLHMASLTDFFIKAKETE